MLTLKSIVTSVASHAALELPADLAVAWPGTQLDSVALEEWVEVWCDAVAGVVQRDGPLEQCRVTITSHVFVRPSTATARVHDLGELLRRAFSGRTIPISDFTQAPPGRLGALRMRETEVRDLTRVQGDDQPRPLRHVVILAQGIAQAET